MDIQKLKAKRNDRRRHRVRRSIHGTAAVPRLSVYRSNLHIYAQLIDDEAQVTLAAASSNDKGVTTPHGANIPAATAVGAALAEKAKAKGITQAAYDRGHYRFHGRVKALARAATEAGLLCTGKEDVVKVKKDPAAAPAPKKEKSVKGGGGPPAAKAKK
jgi:large subunit ribosomal protein L18